MTPAVRVGLALASGHRVRSYRRALLFWQWEQFFKDVEVHATRHHRLGVTIAYYLTPETP